MVWQPDGEKSLTTCLAVLIEHWRVNTQTDILRQLYVAFIIIIIISGFGI